MDGWTDGIILGMQMLLLTHCLWHSLLSGGFGLPLMRSVYGTVGVYLEFICKVVKNPTRLKLSSLAHHWP